MKKTSGSTQTSLPEDRQRIDDEHNHLQKILSDLEAACHKLQGGEGCDTCDSEQQAACQGRINSFLYHLHHTCASHFAHEEFIMQNHDGLMLENDHIREHEQDHRVVLSRLEALTAECLSMTRQRRSAEAYRRLFSQAMALLHEHDHSRDKVILDAFDQQMQPGPP